MIVPPATGAPPTVTLPLTLPSPRLPQPITARAATANTTTQARVTNASAGSIRRIERFAPIATGQTLERGHGEILRKEAHVAVRERKVCTTRMQAAEGDVVLVVHQHWDDRVDRKLRVPQVSTVRLVSELAIRLDACRTNDPPDGSADLLDAITGAQPPPHRMECLANG